MAPAEPVGASSQVQQSNIEAMAAARFRRSMDGILQDLLVINPSGGDPSWFPRNIGLSFNILRLEGGFRNLLNFLCVRNGEFSDNSGAGKTVGFRPLPRSQASEVHVTGTSGYMSDGSRARILVVEDEEALARLVKGHLERAGHDVHVENAGKPALAFATEHRTDLVVLDLMLPDMSGYDVCVELRRLYHPWILPVVMLTALNQPKHQLLGFSHGAEAYLTKPVQTIELLGTVAVMLQRASERRA